MLAQLVEHVVEEAQAGVYLRHALSVEGKQYLDIRFFGRPVNGHRPRG